MYQEIGKVSSTTVSQLKAIAKKAKWECHVSETTSHDAASCHEALQSVDEIVDRWPVDTWKHATFLRLKPGCKLYRHADQGSGFHIPIQTNKNARSFSYENGTKKEERLNAGRIYLANRSIEHESINNGKTDRIHLILILKE